MLSKSIVYIVTIIYLSTTLLFAVAPNTVVATINVEMTPDGIAITPDNRFAYVANPLGLAYFDKGVGGFLESPQNPRPDWAKLAGPYTGKFKTPTLRNVDKRPRPDFIKAYMHNGYLKSLKEVVHFYNTRDSLPRCRVNDPGEKTTCWPAPEYASTMNKRQLGKLHLTEQQENQIVAFMKTLTDGFVPKKN